MATVHGTCLVIDDCGVLLRGPSGSGKSDLALRAIEDGGGRLVADDQVALAIDGDGCLSASAPAMLTGRIEVRGLGIVEIDHAASARVDVVVDLVGRDQIERMPQHEDATLMGLTLPLYRLHAFDASALARLRLIARRTRGGVPRP